MNVFLWNARARNGHVEATLNHPFPAQVLEALLRSLCGEAPTNEADSDADSDDEAARGTTLAEAAPAEALLDVRDSLRDGADAALGFLAEAKLAKDAVDAGVTQRSAALDAALDVALGLARAAFSYLGLLATEDDAEDDDDPLSLHARLHALRPFVAVLIEMDRAPPLPRPDVPRDDAPPPPPDSDDEADDMDFGT